MGCLGMELGVSEDLVADRSEEKQAQIFGLYSVDKGFMVFCIQEDNIRGYLSKDMLSY